MALVWILFSKAIPDASLLRTVAPKTLNIEAALQIIAGHSGIGSI